ncbi:peptidylprolyl isomerase [Aliiglaciecola sp. CAU 1673]|uniref:peptidylprolyl isomerase n=1 Tax=Aliiglaciecola sp. CAU 1673 TaxID=3032595 RepID=UPI0023DAB767|nr:peptidylprolyl isomerase [Aliiglaciecola sp. CAU 1673]MDF2178273.1 peptidylprolyl isomerase [Aliiglaciecola sp. CAU 1673]
MRIFVLLALLVSTTVFSKEWRTPDPDNLVYLHLESGIVVIELAPFMAPRHTEQFKALVREGFYNGLDFYRVIEGFVAQGGDVSEKKASAHKGKLKAEFVRPLFEGAPFSVLESPDLFAPQAGYLRGFAAGRDPEAKVEWLLHCPGTVAMARDNEADSGTTDFYITLGQAPRHLDRNMSVFGRVIYGMPLIQALPRGNPEINSGVIDDPKERGKILKAVVAGDLPKEKHLAIEVQEQESDAFKKKLAQARTMESPFFHYKGNGKLDICYHLPKSRLQP